MNKSEIAKAQHKPIVIAKSKENNITTPIGNLSAPALPISEEKPTETTMIKDAPIAKSTALSPSVDTITHKQPKTATGSPKQPKVATGRRNRFALSFSDEDAEQIQMLSKRLHLPAATMLRSWILEKLSFAK